MKTRALKNYDSSVGVEIYDIDLNSNEEILELGRIVAEQCWEIICQHFPDVKAALDSMAAQAEFERKLP